MFSLTAVDLEQRILGCADGPAAFNSMLARRGGRVVSADPLYEFSADEIQDRIEATFDEVLEKVAHNREEYVWTEIASPEDLGQERMAAMEAFLLDFERGKTDERYVCASLPELPFPDDSFDLALCSHFLFLYSPQLDEEFHVNAIQEMGRVAPEARIFPVVELDNQRSRHLDSVMARLAEAGYKLTLETVQYEFQRGGNQMLRVQRPVT